VLDIADRAVILEHGRVVYDGEPAGAARAIDLVMRARRERSVVLHHEHWSAMPNSASTVRSFPKEVARAAGTNGSSIRRTWN